MAQGFGLFEISMLDLFARTLSTRGEYIEIRMGHTGPRPGKEAESDFGSCPTGTTNAGQYHTHAADSKGKYYDYLFSNSDMTWSENEGVPSFVGRPDGNIMKYTPIPGAPHASGPAVIVGSGAR